MKAHMAAKTPIDMATATPIFSAGRICTLRSIHHGMMAKVRSPMPEYTVVRQFPRGTPIP